MSFKILGMSYTIAFDDERPQVVDILQNNAHFDWQKSVRTGVRLGNSKHKIDKAGLHTLRIYMVDTALSLQKIMIDTGGLLLSYLDAEQNR